MDHIKEFQQQKDKRIQEQGKSAKLKSATDKFILESIDSEYSYNFSWMGRPIIQYPQDIIAMQELIWDIKPDLIIETGIAHGGSLIFSASMLELLGGNGHVLGIDIDIREHNKIEIEKHPMAKRISMIQGSSIDAGTIAQVEKFAKGKERILVCLDSNHTHAHVLQELELYSPFVSLNSYLVVFDTIVEDWPKGTVKNRPWDKGDNPKTAVWEFLKMHKEFEIDKSIQNKLLITVAPDGYLKRIK